MNTFFFDTGYERRNTTFRCDKYHSSVLPLQPMTFLVKRNPTALPEKFTGFKHSEHINKVQKNNQSIRHIKINFLSLHQTNLM